MSRRQLRPGDNPLKPWSEDHPEYQRLREHDPVHAVTCPACAGAGGHATSTGVQAICSLCSGVGKVVPAGMQDGQPTYRTAYFIAGPALQLREPPPPQPGRRRQRPSSFKVSYCFSPTFPGTIEEERFGRFVQLMSDLAAKRLAEKTGAGNAPPPTGVPPTPAPDPAAARTAKRQERRRRSPAVDAGSDAPEIPCPS